MTSTQGPSMTMPHRGRLRLETTGAIPCREYDPQLWFAERPEQVELAKALCRPMVS